MLIKLKMKTIEEAARKYAESVTLNAGADRTKRENAFRAGVEFAQEWIPVEKELPDPGIMVLTKDRNSYIGFMCIRHGDWDYKYKNTITHWRPIIKK